MNKLQLLLAASILTLPGCGYMSFAPPEVSLTQRTPDRSVSRQCLAEPQPGHPINADFDGAMALIDNFIDSYRCTIRVAADGRQAFQLPGFLALVGSATATAFGGGRNWAIGGGAASSILAAGNTYYDPTVQTQVLSDALEALDCIQAEAVGVDAFARLPRAQNSQPNARKAAADQLVQAAERRATDAREAAERASSAATTAANRASLARASLSDAARRTEAATHGSDPSVVGLQTDADRTQAEAEAASSEFRRAQNEVTEANQAVALARHELAAAIVAAATMGDIEISSGRQYFNMISAALLDVEVAAAQRLSRRGTPFDGAAVAAHIADLAQEADKARQRSETPPPPANDLVEALGRDRALTLTRVQLSLAELRPKLQQCIIRAQV